MARYLAHLWDVTKECNPVANRRIGAVLAAYAVFFVGMFSISEAVGVTPDDTPFVLLGTMAIAFVALCVFYNVLGFELEVKERPDLFFDRFRRTGFVFTRCTGFFIINFSVLVGLFMLTVQPLYDWLLAAMLLTPGTFVGDVLIANTFPQAYLFYGLLWYAFPRWLFNSMPFAYDKATYGPATKRGLRQAIVPAFLFLFAINLIVASYDYLTADLIGGTEVLGIVISNVLSAASVIASMLSLVVALVAAARLSGLSDQIGKLHEAHAQDERSIDQRAAVSDKIMAWRLFPYTDGRFAFYPGGIWSKGYVLTPDQARVLFDRIDKKGLGFVQLLIIGVLAVWVGNTLIFSDTLDVGHLFSSGWFYVFLLVLAVVGYIVGMRIRTRMLKRRFGALPVCRHPFPSDYFRLRNIMAGFFKIWVLVFFIIFLTTGGAALGFVLYVEGFTSLGPGAAAAGFVSMLAFGVFYIRLLHRQIRFRRLNGRPPRPSDLGPIDPQTGKMAKRPFHEPI